MNIMINGVTRPMTAAEEAQFGAADYSLAERKALKLLDLEAFDKEESSEGVNWFYLDGRGMWINKETRRDLRDRLERERAAGATIMTVWYDITSFTMPLAAIETLLSAINRYADLCYDVTQVHRSNIAALSTIDEIDAYDYTVGYPDKLRLSPSE